MTSDEHQDLTIRLEALIGEYAAASQRPEATAKLHDVLARIPIVAATATPVSDPPQAASAALATDTTE